MKGEWPLIFRIFMRDMLLGPDGFVSSGAALELAGEAVHLPARLANVLSDEDGIRMVADGRGANAIKCCRVHANVVSKTSNLEGHHADAVDICCSDYTAFKPIKHGYHEHIMSMLLEAEREHDAGRLTTTR